MIFPLLHPPRETKRNLRLDILRAPVVPVIMIIPRDHITGGRVAEDALEEPILPMECVIVRVFPIHRIHNAVMIQWPGEYFHKKYYRIHQ